MADKKKVSVKISIGGFGGLILWSLLSGLIGMGIEGDGLAFGKYVGYTLLVGLYCLTAFIPFGGIYFLATIGNVTETLLSMFSMSGNAWLAFGVDGLFLVFAWIVQVVMIIVAVVIIVMIVNAAKN